LSRTPDADLTSIKQMRHRFAIDDVVKAMVNVANVQPHHISDTRWQQHDTDARRAALYLCRRYTMNSMREISETFDITSSGVHYVLKHMNTRISLIKQAVRLLEQQSDDTGG